MIVTSKKWLASGSLGGGIFFWLFLGMALGACRPLFDRQVSGRVLEIEGTANKTLRGTVARLTNDAPIGRGERISSGSDSRVDLMLLPGLLIELKNNTDVEIERLDFSKDGNETIEPMKSRKARLRLLRGSLFVSLGQTQSRTQLFVETSAGLLSARSGRTFSVETDGPNLRVMSVRGKTNFQPAGGGSHLTIGPGYFVQWPADADRPRAAAEAGAQAQAEVADLLAIEQRLHLLEQQKRFTFVPWARR